MKKLKNYSLYLLFYGLFHIFRHLPYSFSSFYAGQITKSLGRFFKADKTSLKNLSLVFPTFSEKRKRAITDLVWENLGRNFAELASLTKLSKKSLLKKLTIKGAENLDPNKKYIFFTAHYSNWEICNLALDAMGFTMNTIYRPANNVLVDNFVKKIRQKNRNIFMHKKGVKGAREFIKHLKKGESGGILIDQKLSEGKYTDLLGRKVKSSIFIATVAKKYEYNLVPGFATREGSNLTINFEKPISFKEIKDKDDVTIMNDLNKYLDKWITQKPEEWFWLHNRFN